MASIRAEAKAPVLALDAGNLLFKNTKPAPGLQEQELATAEGIAAAYSAMGFDAVGVAPRDLAGGLGFLKKISADSRLPWLSANLVEKGTRSPIFTPYLTRRLGAIQVAVIGITDQQAAELLSAGDGVELLDWRAVLPELVARLAKSADLVILLSSYPPAVNSEIAANIPGIHLLVQAGVGAANFVPQPEGNTLICQAGRQGKFMGRLAIHWTASRRWAVEARPEMLAAKKNELEGMEAAIKRLEGTLEKQALATHQGYQDLLKNRDRRQAELKTLTEAAAKTGDQAAAGSASTYKNSFITLENAMPDDPKVRDIVEKTKQLINEIGARAGQPRSMVLPDQPQGPTPAPATGTDPSGATAYAGARACGGCHPAVVAFWEKTRHAAAFATLAAQKQDFNPICLTCHVTSEPGAPEAALLTLPAELRQVGCEACHGPGRRHAQDPGHEKLAAKPAAALCLRCHTPERDNHFNFETAIRLVGCPAA